jgi:hypothetical protein
MKDPFVTLSVLKDPFITKGTRRTVLPELPRATSTT